MKDLAKVLLEDLKKASTRARGKMATKYGRKDYEDFKKYLEAILADEKPNESLVDMVVAFDTTGSMSSYIASVRSHVEDLVKTMFSNTPGLKMKIVAFGDYCDMTSKDVFGNAYQETSLTDDQDTLSRFVRSARNTSGGDTEEFYELVIKRVTEETPWREGSKRVLLLIADASPHELGYTYPGTRAASVNFITNNQIDWKVEARKAAKLGIQIDTLRIHPKQKWYQELSDITGGVCMDFKTSENIHHVVEASTYLRGASGSFKAKFRGATASEDRELVGAMKAMYMTTDHLSEEDKVELEGMVKEMESKSKK